MSPYLARICVTSLDTRGRNPNYIDVKKVKHSGRSPNLTRANINLLHFFLHFYILLVSVHTVHVLTSLLEDVSKNQAPRLGFNYCSETCPGQTSSGSNNTDCIPCVPFTGAGWPDWLASPTSPTSPNLQPRGEVR